MADEALCSDCVGVLDDDGYCQACGGKRDPLTVWQAFKRGLEDAASWHDEMAAVHDRLQAEADAREPLSAGQQAARYIPGGITLHSGIAKDHRRSAAAIRDRIAKGGRRL